MWHLTKLALRNRVVTLIIALALAAISIWAVFGLKTEFIPDIEFPYLTIVTIYPQADPDTVVQDVTNPVEKIVWDNWSGKSLKHVTSTSANNMSLVMAEFEFGADMQEITTTLNLEIAKLNLPAAVKDYSKMAAGGQNPQVIPINMSMLPLESLSLSGNLPPDRLKQIAETQIIPAIKNTPGVLRVDTQGGQSDQVVIAPDPAKMTQYGVSMAQIAAFIPSNSTSLEEVANTSLSPGGPKLAAVAGISRGLPPFSTITRTNGQTSVGITITKTDDSNTVDTAKAINQAIVKLKADLPDGVELITVFDQSDYITTSINQVWEKGIVGGILAIAIVFLFLWAVRASLVTAISIPLSVLIGFLCMRLAGITINLLTLSAMSIAIGRLIDDSIVMVEVVFRRCKSGENFKDAALGGAKEIANPITSATLATVAIFVPLMFVGGIIGELFVPFALTVTFAMAASLLVALMVVPALSRFLSGGNKKIEPMRDNWYQRFYSRLLRWSLLHRAMVIILSIVLLAGSLGLLPVIGTSFMSGMSEKSVTVSIKMPVNSGVGETSALAERVETLLNGNPAIKNYYTSIGTGTSMQGLLSAVAGGGDNTASIKIYLKADADIQQEADTLTQKCLSIAGSEVISVSDSESGGSSLMSTSGVNISVQGANQEDVAAVTQQLMERLNHIDGLVNPTSDLTTVSPKLTITPDMNKVMASGLPVEQLTALQQEYFLLMMGSTLPAKNVTLNGEAYSVYIKGVTQGLTSVDEAKALKIGYPKSVNLGDLANISFQELPSHVAHTDTALSASITAAITNKDVGAVNQAIQKEIDSLPAHPGVIVKTAGIAEEMADTFTRMGLAILIAIVIVFAIVILMMRSFRNPLIIMCSLPLASIGAILGLAISGYTISVTALMGILMLVGIVLTNAIVLVTLVESLRKNGMATNEALMEGGKIRLRPILMTALTTIFAMLPMVIGLGTGSLLTTELAVVVIGGMFSSTILTLLVIPVIYSLVYNRKTRSAV
jgi:hydrophobic/amphiphilic exporter-1 (mainly G- bacteria), HAE1 family